MSEPANELLPDALDHIDEICRDERCTLLGVHLRGKHCRHHRGERSYGTRSRRYAAEPWRVYSYAALHECVFRAVSAVEPRTFSMILRHVEEDYGSCCERSVHRHLHAWRESGEIVRLDFKGRIHAYLRAGSRLISDPGLVLEQILDVHAEAMAHTQNRGRGKTDAFTVGAA